MVDADLLDALEYAAATGVASFVTVLALGALVFDVPGWVAAARGLAMGLTIGAVFFYGRWRGFSQ